MNPELEKGIETAIRREQATYKHYVRLSKNAGNPNTEALFRELALQEMKHEHLLEEFKKTKDFKEAKELVETHFVNENIALVEALSLTVTKEGLIEGFQQAMRQEQEDAKFYTVLQAKVTDQSTRDLFHYLIAEEQEHERLIRKEYEKYKGTF